MLGPPDTVVELGNTEVNEEIFMDYLSSLGETTYRCVYIRIMQNDHFWGGSCNSVSLSRYLCVCVCVYRGERYRLFEHNCNTFTNEVAQFLTGRKIPSYITDLPSEVLSTCVLHTHTYRSDCNLSICSVHLSLTPHRAMIILQMNVLQRVLIHLRFLKCHS